MRGRSLAGPVIRLQAKHPDRHFVDPAAWQTHLDQLGIAVLDVTPDPETTGLQSVADHDGYPPALSTLHLRTIRILESKHSRSVGLFVHET